MLMFMSRHIRGSAGLGLLGSNTGIFSSKGVAHTKRPITQAQEVREYEEETLQCLLDTGDTALSVGM